MKQFKCKRQLSGIIYHNRDKEISTNIQRKCKEKAKQLKVIGDKPKQLVNRMPPMPIDRVHWSAQITCKSVNIMHTPHVLEDFEHEKWRKVYNKQSDFEHDKWRKAYINSILVGRYLR